MGNMKNFLTKLLAVAVLIGLGVAYSAKADSYSTTTTFYYVGPSTDGPPPDNPYGLTNSIGNPISGLAITSAGSTGTLTVNTATGITLTGTDFTVNLVGSNSIVSGGALVTGTYTFTSASDYYGMATALGNTVGACNPGQNCNMGSSPGDVFTVNVSGAGIVTISSSSLELAAMPSGGPSGVPEIDPSSAMSSLALLAGLVMIMRGRRKE
jgi:hypothetical protein